jgi:flavin reductase
MQSVEIGQKTAVSSKEFISAMRQFSAAVNIITTGDGSERAGLTATAVLSLTAEPPQIAIAVNHTASAYPLLSRSGRFCVNTLAAGQEDLAARFAGPVKGEERFAEGEWLTLATGAPALSGALVNFDCRTERAVDFSTHTLFIGEVMAIQRGTPAKPLLFVDGNWASLLPAMRHDVDEASSFMRRSIETIEDAAREQGPDAALDRFVRAFTKLNIAERTATREHLGAELYALPSSLRSLTAATREFDDRFLDLLQKGIEDGEFDVRDPRIASFAIVGMIVWTFKWYRANGRLTQDEVAEQLALYARRIVGVDDHTGSRTVRGECSAPDP